MWLLASQRPEAAKPTISQNLETTPRRLMASNKSSAAVPSFSYLAFQAKNAAEDAGDQKAPNSSSSASVDGDNDEATEARAAAWMPEHWRTLNRPSWAPPKDYDSDTEAWRANEPRRRRRWVAREMNLERSWQMRRYGSGGDGCECVVVVRPQGDCGRRISMDMEEVRACRDLGLHIPLDFTVEVPGGLAGNTSSSCCNSPIGNGEDPVEIKAKIRMWAQAVAFVSAASRCGS